MSYRSRIDGHGPRLGRGIRLRAVAPQTSVSTLSTKAPVMPNPSPASPPGQFDLPRVELQRLKVLAQIRHCGGGGGGDGKTGLKGRGRRELQ